MQEAADGSLTPSVVACTSYAGGRRVAEILLDDCNETLAASNDFIWIGLEEPPAEVLRHIQREFGLHDLAVEDALSAHQRPKLEQYDNSLFVVMRTAHVEPGGHLEFGETHVFVGERFVVSVRHGAFKSHGPVRAKCEAVPDQLKKGPGFVLYSLMDFIVDQYMPIVDSLEERLEALEEEVFGEKRSKETTSRIYALKRDLVGLKRAVSPVVDICNRLMRADEIVHDDTRPYFRDIYDHAIRVNEHIDSLRELLSAALDANLSLISVSQNDDTKRLAAWAAIVAVPTLIAGVYGMNFEGMPELHWAYGYPIALGSMIFACLVLFAGFKRSGWL